MKASKNSGIRRGPQCVEQCAGRAHPLAQRRAERGQCEGQAADLSGDRGERLVSDVTRRLTLQQRDRALGVEHLDDVTADVRVDRLRPDVPRGDEDARRPGRVQQRVRLREVGHVVEDDERVRRLRSQAPPHLGRDARVILALGIDPEGHGQTAQRALCGPRAVGPEPAATAGVGELGGQARLAGAGPAAQDDALVLAQERAQRPHIVFAADERRAEGGGPPQPGCRLAGLASYCWYRGRCDRDLDRQLRRFRGARPFEQV